MGVFHVFKIVQIVPNRATHRNRTMDTENQSREDPNGFQNGSFVFFLKSVDEIFLISDVHENSKALCIVFVENSCFCICSSRMNQKVTLLSFSQNLPSSFFVFVFVFLSNKSRGLWLLKSLVYRFSFLFVLICKKMW